MPSGALSTPRIYTTSIDSSSSVSDVLLNTKIPGSRYLPTPYLPTYLPFLLPVCPVVPNLTRHASRAVERGSKQLGDMDADEDLAHRIFGSDSDDDDDMPVPAAADNELDEDDLRAQQILASKQVRRTP